MNNYGKLPNEETMTDKETLSAYLPWTKEVQKVCKTKEKQSGLTDTLSIKARPLFQYIDSLSNSIDRSQLKNK